MTARRRFLKRCLAVAGAAALLPKAVQELVLEKTEPGLGLGFRNDAPTGIDRFTRPAAWAASSGRQVRCELCPHECVLGDDDRGFCRTRFVKDGALYTAAYGNACTLALDPIEKKPLYHYLPGTPILSVAIGGCNLRCLNCQNWEISQKRPEDVSQRELMPADFVSVAERERIPLLAFTYTEPLVSYEYVCDTAALAHERGLRNVLVTAGYVNPRPLRQLSRVLDAVTLDLKAFDEALFRDLAGGRLAPVLRTLEILKQEGVWTEVSFLMVPTLSDSPAQVERFARWVVRRIGPSVPMHLLRFHAAHRLQNLPRTPVPVLEEARERALQAGLHHVYLGNVPGHAGGHTDCPACGRVVIERLGMGVTRNDLDLGRCPCGAALAGVWT